MHVGGTLRVCEGTFSEGQSHMGLEGLLHTKKGGNVNGTEVNKQREAANSSFGFTTDGGGCIVH